MTSMFVTKFTRLKKVVEEAVTCRYYSRLLGMKVTEPTIAHENNIDAVVSSSDPGSILQHKNKALSYNFCREYCTEEIAQIRHIKSKCNLADSLTK